MVKGNCKDPAATFYPPGGSKAVRADAGDNEVATLLGYMWKLNQDYISNNDSVT